MASVAEQLASNISFSAFRNATELKKRIWFTLLALLVYRLGTYLPLPGINIDTLTLTECKVEFYNVNSSPGCKIRSCESDSFIRLSSTSCLIKSNVL